MRNYYKKKRVQILNEIARSELMKIASVEEHNVGTHFLLKVDTRKSHEEIYEEGIKRDLHISFFSDYSVKNVDETGTVTLVINYAAISGDKIGEVVKRLTEILVN